MFKSPKIVLEFTHYLEEHDHGGSRLVLQVETIRVAENGQIFLEAERQLEGNRARDNGDQRLPAWYGIAICKHINPWESY